MVSLIYSILIYFLITFILPGQTSIIAQHSSLLCLWYPVYRRNDTLKSAIGESRQVASVIVGQWLFKICLKCKYCLNLSRWKVLICFRKSMKKVRWDCYFVLTLFRLSKAFKRCRAHIFHSTLLIIWNIETQLYHRKVVPQLSRMGSLAHLSRNDFKVYIWICIHIFFCMSPLAIQIS